ncbi:hypothetical protein GOP47_0003527 [Adiantum capillus-veneris]|uniref:DYW domain-containing protein n=1 Tax=Adiantum capillus-veneris TaxID=13818 RepID=A0A9D4ZQ47_ADICA|nr:hypothetical protein GOP47_0003527 [Adiantum capillus-veneris]
MRRAYAGHEIVVIRKEARNFLHVPLPVFLAQYSSLCRSLPLARDCLTLLKECTTTQDIAQGRIIHDLIVRNGPAPNKRLLTSNFIIDMYNACGSCNEALNEFSVMYERNVYSWTIIITTCVKHDQCSSALQLFRQMQLEGICADEFTYSSMLGVFTAQESLTQGKSIHACIIACGFHGGAIVLTAIVNLYGKCGRPEIARTAFDAINIKDAASWNSMIAAYAYNAHPKEALELYHQMQQNKVMPSSNTFISALRACSTPEALLDGKRIHADIVGGNFCSDLVKTALLSMYSSCASLDEAQTVFHEIRQHDVVSFNAMICAFVQHDRGKDAVDLYGQMWKKGIKPTCATLVNVLSACSLLGATTRGRKIHMLVPENGFEFDNVLATTIVSMYGKCGQLADAWAAFTRICSRGHITWNAILNAYAQNGDNMRVLELFKQMLHDEVKPDEVTYISVLYACSHSGSLKDAQEYFDSMQKNYGIEPNSKHYACMIDLFGRAGLVEEAENLMKKMPIEPDTVVLTAYSGACRVRNDTIRGKWAAERIMALDPRIEAPYIALSNFYAAEGRWKDVAEVRRKMEQNVQKRTGRSWIEVENIVHEFVTRDQSHVQSKDIYETLHHFDEELKKTGFFKETVSVLNDTNKRSEDGLVCHHSEMLAIAFGFLNVPEGGPICVFKNLPVCPDCHAATKAISKMVDREVVIRDVYRFHHFVNGRCSCGDYL